MASALSIRRHIEPGVNLGAEMMADPPETDVRPFELFVEECRSEYEQAQSEAKEIALLIQQTTSEVERLVRRKQRYAVRPPRVDPIVSPGGNVTRRADV